MTSKHSTCTIWVDVEDLFQYAVANPRPSGIQRLVFEILQVLRSRAAAHPAAPRIVFARHGDDDTLLREIGFDSILALFGALSGDAPALPAAAPQQAAARPLPAPRRPAVPRRPPSHRLRHFMIRRLQALPPQIGEPLLEAGVRQLQVLRQARQAWRRRGSLSPLASHPLPATSLSATSLPTSQPAPSTPAPAADAAHAATPPAARDSGDILLCLGASWSFPDYGARLERVRARLGLRPVLLVYDLIPLRRPEWCARPLVADFVHWLDTVMPQCRALMAISHATARDVDRYVVERGLSLASPVVPIPLGTGFSGVGPGTAPAGLDARPPGLPPAGSYVLFVSTIEARKNHALLFRVWRRLLREMPRAQVPTLVFAGRVGWLVADLMQQLDNTEWLHGKIRLLRDPSDAELMHLYDGCLFTLFPSLFEGWGLPVTESLMLGRPCIASSATSVPEAGGSLCRYFNPESLDDACRVIRDTLADPDGLAAWRAQVRAEFTPVAWDRSADAILDLCTGTDMQGASS